MAIATIVIKKYFASKDKEMKKSAIIIALLAISAQASAQSSDTSGQPDWIEQAKIVSKMEGISVGEAIRRGKLERKLAEQQLRLESDPTYAGSEIIRDSKRYRIVHYFTTDAATSGDAELDKESEFRKIRFNMKEMKEFQKSASQLIIAADANAYTTISASENRVYLFTSNAGAVTAALASIGGIPAFVEIKAGGWFSDDQALMMGGGAVSATSGSCTAGFNVKGSLTGVSTAGHCVQYGLQNYQGTSIGTHRGPAQTSATMLAGRDFTWYRNDAHTYNNTVKYQASFYAITSVAPANPAVNTSACLIKQDGTQACAYVAQVATPPSGSYPTVIMDRVISINGDSGGPWLYGSVAYGIHHGKKCDDAALTVNCRSLYSPAANMPAAIGVSVIVQ